MAWLPLADGLAMILLCAGLGCAYGTGSWFELPSECWSEGVSLFSVARYSGIHRSKIAVVSKYTLLHGIFSETGRVVGRHSVPLVVGSYVPSPDSHMKGSGGFGPLFSCGSRLCVVCHVKGASLANQPYSRAAAKLVASNSSR